MSTDILIIGSGIAGAAAALDLSRDSTRRVTLLTRTSDMAEANSSWAQGGIVGRGEDDDANLLAEDVERAGSGLSWSPAVRQLAEDGPAVIERLVVQDAGLAFDADAAGHPVFGLEGAHSRRRILHVGDATGRAIMVALQRTLAARANVEIRTEQTAVDLLTFPHHARDPRAIYRSPICHGAYVLDRRTGSVCPIVARATVLATGGLGQIYLNTTNRPGARGDGIAMATRAGARVAHMEYIQFHPTALHGPETTKLLISEAVRGEGGVLLTPDGHPFMERYSSDWKDLAPRDVVARAIYWEMLAHDWPYVLLDIASRRPAAWIRERFPQIVAGCADRGLDITTTPVPVVPAAHYLCGGVLVDLHGRTTLDNLWAIGEVSCTGVHGANRLASTSLLEGLVWGARAAADIRARKNEITVSEADIPEWDVTGSTYDADPALIQGDFQTIRNLMWHYVGLVRSEFRLNRAIRELSQLQLTIEDFYRRARLSDGLVGLRNGVQAALLVAHAARRNRVSRGAHWREDSTEAER